MDNATIAIEQWISRVRERFAALLLEIDDIVLQVNPQIEAEYATKIGYLENDLLKWQIAARRARRRCMLAQARVNSGLSFDSNEFEVQLDEELSEWESLLAKSVSAFLEATELLAASCALSPVGVKRCRQELAL